MAAPFAYFGARFLGQTGQNLFLAALFVAAGTSGSAALGLSSIFIATLVPAIILGLPGGALADRLGAGNGYVLGAIFRFLAVATAVLVIHDPALVWLPAALYSAGSQVYTPAEMAMVSAVQPKAAGRAHSYLIALQYAGQGTGMLLLAPALYFLGGTETMMVGAAITFALLVGATTYLGAALRGTAASVKVASRRAFSFGETFRYFGREPRAGYAVGLLGFKAVAAKCMVVALPFYLERDLGLGAEGVAYLLAPGVLGIVVGLVWAGRYVNLESAPSVMRLALMGMLVSVFALAVLDYGLMAAAQYSQVPPIARLEASMNTTMVAALPVAFLIGTCMAGALVSARLVLSETAPIGQQARVFATQLTLTEAVLILPLAIAGIGTEFAGARVTLVILGVMGVGLFVLLEGFMAARSSRPLPAPLTTFDPPEILGHSSAV
ncbi:MAG: MFS transporter [Tepidiformaceae bacterium]